MKQGILLIGILCGTFNSCTSERTSDKEIYSEVHEIRSLYPSVLVNIKDDTLVVKGSFESRKRRNHFIIEAGSVEGIRAIKDSSTIQQPEETFSN